MGFSRLHLWRLEIVPMLAFFASLGAVARHLRIAADFSALSILPFKLLTPMYTSTLAIVAILWLAEVRMNYGWVAREERKRFHWMILPTHFAILTLAWALVQTASIESSMVEQTRPVHLSAALLFFMIVPGIVYTAIVEATRPHAKYDRMAEPTPPEPGADGVYVDKDLDWFQLLVFLAIAAIMASPCLLGASPRIAFDWVAIVCGAIGASMSFRKVTVSHDSVVVKYGLARTTIRVADIVDCRAMLDSRCRGVLARLCSLMSNATGRCLELRLRNGKQKTIWMVRPSYACSILRPMIESARSSEPVDTGIVG